MKIVRSLLVVVATFWTAYVFADGVRLSNMKEGSALEKMGLRNNDIILEVNGEKVNSFFEFSKKISTHMPRAILGKNNYLKFLLEILKEKQNLHAIYRCEDSRKCCLLASFP